jgi:hypothetical protein
LSPVHVGRIHFGQDQADKRSHSPRLMPAGEVRAAKNTVLGGRAVSGRISKKTRFMR